MDIFHALTMLGGLCLFLFGMNLMGQALERRAGGKLRTLLDKMTGSVGAGFLTGLGITAIIQSSSATTVMVVGFVNSGLMTLRQAINVIMGANVGTTVTAWLLSLAGIDGGSVWLQLLKPTAFTPVLALVGIIFYMFCKDSRKKETGSILLGFATLMFGMDTMSAAVAGLKDVPGFAELFLAFTNPLLGVLVGAVLTAIIQSSSASVGILQALAITGAVTFEVALPIVMGIAIAICATGATFGVVMTIFSFCNTLAELPNTLSPMFAYKKYPKCCDNSSVHMNRKVAYVLSVLTFIVCAYLCVQMAATLSGGAVAGILAVFVVGYVYFFFRVKYLKGKGVDLIAEMKAPYQPWEDKEKSYN